MPLQCPRWFRISALLTLAIAFAGLAHGAGDSAERGTADWIRAHIHVVRDKRIPIYVTSVSVGRIEGTRTLVTFHTGFRGTTWGGSLAGWVTNERVAGLARDFGSEQKWDRSGNVATRTIMATVRVDSSGRPMIQIDGERNEVGAEPPAEKPAGAPGSLVRTWTSVDGKAFDGELLSATSISAKIRRTGDGQVFDVPLERLCQADRDFIARH